MTDRRQRWTEADQARLEAALKMDSDANLAFARLAAHRQSTSWLRAERGDARKAVGQPASKA